MNSRPEIPPIPQVPITDENGKVAREWWRWFHLVFTNQQASSDDIGLALYGQIPPPPSVPPGQGALLAGAILPPGDPPGASLRNAVATSLAVLQPADPPGITLRQAVLAAMLFQQPPDPPPNPDEIIRRALMMGPPL